MKNKRFKIRKRLQALLLAVVVTVTTLGSVTTVAAKSSFSFPFDFLLFHFGEEEENMTEKELEAERERLREQSKAAEKEAGLKLVYEYTMDTPQALSTLDLSGCKGEGTFVFADPEFVPKKGVTVCEIVFTPKNVNAYDYDLMLGWDEDTETLRRYAEVICTSLVELEEEVTDESEESVIPDAVETTPEAEVTPEATPTPEAEVTPEVTPTPEAEVTPEVTPTPEAEATPEVTPTPDAEATPEVTPTPDTEETPKVTPTPDAEETPKVTPTPDAEETPKATPAPDTEVTPEVTPEPEVTSAPEKEDEQVPESNGPIQNLIPEITGVPETATPTPEAVPTPEPVVTAPINPGSSLDNGVQVIKKDEAVLALETQIMEFAEGEMTSERIQLLVELTRDYNELTAEQKDAVSSDAMNKLISLQDAAAAVNHTSNGVTVSGNVPWYAQLIVVLGNDTDTYVPTGLDTIVPYEMYLWNLLTDSEYILGGGEKVTLTMAVPENIHLYDGVTIVHYMDETHYEYIELKITGDTMSFETASFSPFNVAGSTILVGGKTDTDEDNTVKPVDTTKPAGTTKPSDATTTKPSGGSNTTKPSGSNSSQNTGNNKNESNKPSSNKTENTNKPVKTGDEADISRFIMLGMGAAVLAVLCILLMKTSREEEIF